MKRFLTLLMLALATALVAHADPAPERLPFGARPETEEIVFKATVDATDDLVIYNGKLHIEHVARNKPHTMTVNGEAWEPSWEGSTSSSYARFKPKLRSLKDVVAKVELIQGRGEAVIQEQPTKENKYRLVVRITDGGPAAAEAEVKIVLEAKEK
ncbi:hypothetical protein WJU23_23170 [Prosthecobacter sp. SYSU 5D2]|uniref:hypothetical protein n=1 Tax=Prosthecobacter sp. SYSU 5D2 TaxID=3134134 RepID=UPI0031FE999E